MRNPLFRHLRADLRVVHVHGNQDAGTWSVACGAADPVVMAGYMRVCRALERDENVELTTC